MSHRVIPDKQRALVLQGSVGLGAFEAGVFKKLYEKIKAKDPNWKKRMFDIVAGTSAGAINAAILASHFKQNNTWEGSSERLVEYWRDQLSSPTPSVIKLGIEWWDEYYGWWGKYCDAGNRSRTLAAEESARRYYSTKYFFTYGAPNVFSPSSPFPLLDGRFLDNNTLFPPTNLWLRYSNKPLRDSLGRSGRDAKKFVDFPLATSFDKEQPRFLSVSVDVQHGKPVTFDSYSKKSTFQSYDPDTRDYKDHVIKYDKGIMIEHVMASASFPVYFDYEEVDGRKFWDGGILSNTPLREIIHYHREFWLEYFEQNGIEEKHQRVPSLEAYIINVWPSEEKTVPLDHDGVKDRKNDITFSYQTEYDQKVAFLVSDHLDMINDLKNVANDAINTINDSNERKKEKLRTRFNEIFKTKAKSRKRTGDDRTYDDLIHGRFDLERVVTIERKDDPNGISNKWADYTSETINKLISEGENFDRTAVVKIIPPEIDII